MPFALANQLETVADLVHQLGDIPLKRIRMKPPPGTATAKDLIQLLDGPEKVLCELVDGTLVEKVMGRLEGYLAAEIIYWLNIFVKKLDLGAIFGADAPFRILKRRVRLPDVSYVPWEKLPGRVVSIDNVARIIPDLVVEVFSKGNTKNEMKRKLGEYFRAGVRLAWIIYPKTRTAEFYTTPNQLTPIAADQSLTGGDVLPGFELPLAKLFERVEKPKRKKKRG